MKYTIVVEPLKFVQEVIQTSELNSSMPLAFIIPGKSLKEIHRMDASLYTAHEHQIATESPESIHEVGQPVGVTSTTPLVVTLPGKLPNILKIT